MRHQTDQLDKAHLVSLGKKHYWLPNGRDSSYYDRPGAIVVSTEGCCYEDIEGNRVLDTLGCQAASTVGYSNTEVIEAIVKQMKSMITNVSGWPASPSQIMLAEKLAKIAPPGLNKVFYGCTGSDANEIAIKIARQYWKIRGKGSKFKVISRWQSYHGAHFGSGAAAGYPWRRKAFEPLPGGFIHTNPPYCYRCIYHLSYPDCQVECAEELARIIEYEDPSTIAAWIGDLAITALGYAPAPPDYVKRVREICTKYELLMIVDEVITAFGRTGTWFMSEQYGICPDIITVGKGLTGGYMPLSAAIVKNEVAELFTGENCFQHIYTFAGTPTSCAAALANIQFLEKRGVLEEVKAKGRWVASQLEAMQQRLDLIGNWNCTGLAFAVELVKNQTTKQPFANPSLNSEIIASGLRRGLLLYPMGNQPIILFSPPLVISYEELEFLFKGLEAVLFEVKEKF